jgi:hypothetical protein
VVHRQSVYFNITKLLVMTPARLPAWRSHGPLPLAGEEEGGPQSVHPAAIAAQDTNLTARHDSFHRTASLNVTTKGTTYDEARLSSRYGATP